MAGLDYLTGYEISFSIFYLMPVLFVTLRNGQKWGCVFAILCAVTWAMMDAAAGAQYSSDWIPFWNAAVRLGFFLIVVWLLSALRTSMSQLEGLALTDSLTALHNSRFFYAELERELTRQRRSGMPFAVAYIDLDRFKLVNDSCGHPAGDELLRAVGSTISGSLRNLDTVARLGGDEFGILMPETGSEAAQVALTRTHHALTKLFESLPCSVPGVGATIGAVVFTETPESVDHAVAVADGLMYEGKRLGKGMVRLMVWKRTA